MLCSGVIPTWVYRAITMMGKFWIQRTLYQPTQENPPYDLNPQLWHETLWTQCLLERSGGMAGGRSSAYQMPTRCLPDALWTLGALGVCAVKVTIHRASLGHPCYHAHFSGSALGLWSTQVLSTGLKLQASWLRVHVLYTPNHLFSLDAELANLAVCKPVLFDSAFHREMEGE